MKFYFRPAVPDRTWRKWFAWYPVCTESASAPNTFFYSWLEFVERCEIEGHYSDIDHRYREPT